MVLISVNITHSLLYLLNVNFVCAFVCRHVPVRTYGTLYTWGSEVAGYGKVLRYGTVRYGTVRYGTVRYGTVRYGNMVPYRTGTVRYRSVRYGTVRYGTVPYGNENLEILLRRGADPI